MLVQTRGAAVLLLLGLAACGGGGGSDEPAPGSPPPPPSGIGPAGGTVLGPNGSKIEIPPGALTTNVQLAIAQSSTGVPPLPTGFTTAGSIFALTPHGTTFAVPVTVTLPFDPAAVRAGIKPVMFKTNSQDQWEPVANAVFDATTVVAQITSFSFPAVMQPLERRAPIRDWAIFPENQPTQTGPQPLDFGGEIHEVRDFGRNAFITFDQDTTRTLEVFSSADGVTFWASAEDVGGGEMRQSQKFIKRAEDATLRFVITAGLLEAIDFNFGPTPAECPRGFEVHVCAPLHSFIQFSAQARTPLGELLLDRNGRPALDTGGHLKLQGRTGEWEFFVVGDYERTTAVWRAVNFAFTNDVDGDIAQFHPRAKLFAPIVLNVDLSSLDVGDDFRVKTLVRAYAQNLRGPESALGAYVRDPSKSEGTAMNFTGLEIVEDLSPAPDAVRPAEPCANGPDPAAGVLGFSASTYELLERPFAAVASNGVTITRTGGSTGDVSVVFETNGGSATPGVHFVPQSKRVHFPDGDSDPRVVDLGILPNDDNEPDTTVNVTLSQPAGCATLGAITSAVLTILDDDRPAPPPPPSGLDLTFDTDGKATTVFGGDDSAMALQSDGKIIMVGGSITDFVLARYNTDGSLDEDFGIGGRVTTALATGIREEVARAVAIQRDGRIVVAGFLSIEGRPAGDRFDFALARYNTNGTLDDTFGIDGLALSNVKGRAFAVAIQGDDKIVVAGDSPLIEDIVVARYDADGTLDEGFADFGIRITDLTGGGSDLASNLIIEPTGAILVSGPHTKATDTTRDLHTGLVRYTASGAPDGTFGDSGELIVENARVGEGLVRQSDGKLVLAGSIDVAVPPATLLQFAVMRLLNNGTPDDSFGSGGRANTPASTVSEAAKAVTLDADGRIVVAGRSNIALNSNFAVARYDSDGELDLSFDTDGRLSVDFFGFTDIAESVVVQPDGKIVVGGMARDNIDGYGLARIVP